MGRPTKLTPACQARICDAIKVGATFALAAQYGGVSYEAFNKWRKRGENELDRMARAKKHTEVRENESIYVQFVQATKSAEGNAAVGWLAKIEKSASEGAWQAAAWKLERRYPQDYGRTVVDTKQDGRVIVEIIRGKPNG